MNQWFSARIAAHQEFQRVNKRNCATGEMLDFLEVMGIVLPPTGDGDFVLVTDAYRELDAMCKARFYVLAPLVCCSPLDLLTCHTACVLFCTQPCLATVVVYCLSCFQDVHPLCLRVCMWAWQVFTFGVSVQDAVEMDAEVAEDLLLRLCLQHNIDAPTQLAGRHVLPPPEAEEDGEEEAPSEEAPVPVATPTTSPAGGTRRTTHTPQVCSLLPYAVLCCNAGNKVGARLSVLCVSCRETPSLHWRLCSLIRLPRQLL